MKKNEIPELLKIINKRVHTQFKGVVCSTCKEKETIRLELMFKFNNSRTSVCIKSPISRILAFDKNVIATFLIDEATVKMRDAMLQSYLQE